MLKHVSLDVDEHNVVCLIGASGSGKSTLLRCLNLLETRRRGRDLVDGQTITNGRVDVNALRRKIGIVFQAYNLFPHMTVLENVTLAPTQGAQRLAHRRRATARRTCSTASGSPKRPTSSPTASRAASSSASRSRVRSRWSRS